jgi:hypothetical protein
MTALGINIPGIGLTWGDFKVYPPSVHKTGSRDNSRSTYKNIFMKLDMWIDGSIEIMHVFFFSSHVENSCCYGNK